MTAITTILQEDILPLIKRPPQFAPAGHYDSTQLDEDGLPVNFNNLRGKLFQFKYSYVYEDDQESAYSEISMIPLPEGDLTIEGEWVEDFFTNNCIKLTVNTGSSLVEKINIAVREAKELNSGSFNLITIIDKYDSTGERLIYDNVNYVVNFLNNGTIRSVDTDINNRYFDDVPLSASDILLLNAKYLTASMPIKSYDEVVGDFDLTNATEDVGFEASNVYIDSEIIIQNAYQTDWRMTIPPQLLASTYELDIQFENYDTNQFIYVATGSETVEFIRDALWDLMIADPRVSDITKYSTNAIDFTIFATPGENQTRFLSLYISISSTSTFTSFKKGQYHKIGIIYNDEFGRYNVVNNDTAIFVPYPKTKTEYLQLAKINYSINNRPPIWAKTYRFAYIKNMSYTYFLDVILYESTDVVQGGTEGIVAGNTFIKINKAIADYRALNNKMIIPDYVWVKGDRCRNAYPSGAGTDISDKSYEITGEHYLVTMDGDTEVRTYGFLVDGVISNIQTLEIFRPNFEFTGTIFYETGESHEILNWGTAQRSHAGGTVNQSDDLVTPASGTFDFGDVYMRQRKTLTVNSVVEDASYSDFYSSNCMDKGRAAVKLTTNFEQKELHRVVRSENFIEDTEYNLLNVWLPQTDFFTVSQSYGPITGIREVGDVLKIVQEHKETSVYIGKAALKQADGTNLTVLSDQVFNEGNKYDSLYGTKYPRSIATNERNLYYVDDTTGDFIRSSPNGQESLSTFYKWKTYFKSKINELNASVNYTDIITSVDSLYEEVIVTFINGNTSESVAFYEKEGYKGFIYKAQIKPASGVPDNFAWYGDKLFSFLSGKLWKHDIGTDTSFYGDRKPCSVKFIVNAGAGDANKFSDIEISSPDNVWDVQFDINAGTNYPVQKTILKPGIIRMKENRLCSGILRNILGRNNTEDITKLRNGSQMTGETMLVTISNDTSGDWLLKEVEVKFLTSK